MSQPPDDARIRERSGAVNEAWERTIEETELIADERREQGWEAVTIPTVHTSPTGEPREAEDQPGLVHVVPDNHAEAFTDAFEAGEFPEFEVYRNEVEGNVFVVTELVDPETKTVVLIRGRYDFSLAEGMISAAMETEAIYTHVKTIDGTLLGSIRHELLTPFVPGLEHDGDES
ncbi:hypothetical protein [Saliphagus sp. LR7]|uniref:DUF7529 family protein n=1 Tax=Saliphagus sp. LR7 TaxID=2282654 RepID=UPI000DF7F13B|nr:hypothetical protein [Saliphagus sp. LR7]